MVDPAPVVVAPVLPAQPWFTKIDRKVWAGGIGGILASVCMSLMNAYLHIDLGAFLQPFLDLAVPPTLTNPHPLPAVVFLTGFFSMLIGWVVPAAYSDVYKKINSFIIARAITDKTTPTLEHVTMTSVAKEVTKIAIADTKVKT